MRNQTRCGIDNPLPAPVIHIQKHLLCLGILLGKVQHNLRLRAAKTINRLVIIAHNKEIILRLGKHSYHLILQRANILKFIDENILKTLLP